MHQMTGATDESIFWELYSYLSNITDSCIVNPTPCINRESSLMRFNDFKQFMHDRRLEFETDVLIQRLNQFGIHSFQNIFGHYLQISDIICEDGILHPYLFIEYIANGILDPLDEYFVDGRYESFHIDTYMTRKQWVLHLFSFQTPILCVFKFINSFHHFN